MKKRTLLLGGLVSAGMVGGLLPIGLSPAGADVPAPAFWPDGPEIGSTAYTLRMEGDDRYETAASIAFVTTLNQEKTAGYPFEQMSLTPTSRGDDSLPTSTYGLSTCPETIHIGVGDNPADVLAASGVKGITNLPLPGTGILTNVTNAVVLLTDAARGNPGEVLNPRTRDALLAVRDACLQPFNAVILGGPAAVSMTAMAEVDSIANLTVRVDGTITQDIVEAAAGIEIPLDRYATAADLAFLLWTANSPGGGPGGLPDIDVWDSVANEDGTWSFETNTSADDTFADAIFLTEGVKGADPLSLGPVAAAYSSPVLLTRPDELPIASIAMLQLIQPRSLIVVGGEAAVSADVVDTAIDQIDDVANYVPDTLRVAGPTRWSTSVGVATVLAGAVDTQLDGSLFGFARSDRNDGTDAVDALAGGAFLDTAFLSGAAAPERQAPPIERNGVIGGDLRGPTTYIGGGTDIQPGEIYPMLLTLPGNEFQSGLPEPVADYLETLYSQDLSYVTAETPDGVGGEGGFGFVFGGTAAVSAATEQDIAWYLSGGTYGPEQIDGNLVRYNGATDIDPSATLNDIFFTDLSYDAFVGTGAVSLDGGGADISPTANINNAYGMIGQPWPKICVYRDGLIGVARIAAYSGGYVRAVPVDYQNKPFPPFTNATDSVWPPFQSRFTCISMGGVFNQVFPGSPWFGGALVRFQSLSGNEAQSNGVVIDDLQDQLSLGLLGVLFPSDPAQGWCPAQVGPGSSQTATVRYPFGPGANALVPIGSGVAQNFRGGALNNTESGFVEVTCTRFGVQGAPATQNALEINGRVVYNPVAGSGIPGGLTLNFKAETNAANFFALGAPATFSGMYSLGPTGDGPTGGFLVQFTPPIAGFNAPGIQFLSAVGSA